MRSLLFFSFILSLLGQAVRSQSTPEVTIDAGTLRGGRCGSGASYFKSIPYAQPPMGDLRFAPPKAFSGKYSNGTYLATTPAPSCPQFGTEFAETGATNEDCLYIDVWAPANATRYSRLPVKVWIYGGSENAGGISDPLYDGCNIAQDNALLVSINYRLGPLGFLALEGAGIKGNQAIQDLLLGLEWVQKNIAAFGGDPKKVLLFGQSAGAVNTFVLSTLPQAPRLINSAIAESGGGRDVGFNSTAQTLGAAYAQALNCSTVNASCLRSKSINELKTAYENLPLLQEGLGNDGDIGIISPQTYIFYPYLDGDIIPAQPSKVGVRVPTVFGSNSQDGTLFALAQFATEPNGLAGATPANYTTFLQDNFGPLASTVAKYYPLSLFTNVTQYPVVAAISTVITDAAYRCPAYRGLIRAAEKGVPAYSYIFSHTPTCSWVSGLPQKYVQLLGPTHSAEIPFVFGSLTDLPAPNGTCNATAQERKISSKLVSAWTAMAEKGNPSTGSLQWPVYRNGSSLGLNIVNDTTVEHLDYSVCQLWDEVNAYLARPGVQSISSSTVPVLSTATAGVNSRSFRFRRGSTGRSI